MLEKLQKNVTVADLTVGILFYGVLCETICMFAVQRKFYYGMGILIGLFMAIATAVHMNYTIGLALSADEKGAIGISRKYSMLRYAVTAILLAVLCLTGFADPIAAFIGLMGLKIAAYMQPLTHKLVRHFIPDLPPAAPLEELQQETYQEDKFPEADSEASRQGT